MQSISMLLFSTFFRWYVIFVARNSSNACRMPCKATFLRMIAFAQKLRQNQAAVQVGLTLQWNNGVVEGNVNRLKLIKRSMYGRANFDLLRLRVLHHRKCA